MQQRQNNPMLIAESISKTYRIYARPRHRLWQMLWPKGRYYREHPALHPLSLTLEPGQTLGIVGVNGSGKSTLLQILARTLTPSSGQVTCTGRVAALLELGAGFNPEFSGDENITLSGSIYGLSSQEIRDRREDIIAFSGLSAQAISQPVGTYSSGMYVRLAFAVAISVQPDILIIDEALAVGDEAFQRKCYARLRELQQAGCAIIFVSHAASAVLELCNRALWLDQGQLLLDSTPKEVIARYHQYIYAQPEERQRQRDALLHGTTSTEAQEHDAPESCVSYPVDGAEILHPQLLDTHGKPAHLLQPGALYHIRYRIRAERDIDNLRAACMIKTHTGVELAGYMEPLPHRLLTGQEVEVCFTFPAHMREGLYYMNVGISELQQGVVQFLHRIVDVLHFRIDPTPLQENGHFTGVANLGFTAEYTY